MTSGRPTASWVSSLYAVACFALLIGTGVLLSLQATSGRGHLPPEWQFTLPLGVLSAGLGWLLLRRRPGERVGWVIAALGASMAIQTSVTAYGAYSVHVHRLAAAEDIYAAARVPSQTLVPLLATLFLVFPTGTLPSARWRWLGRLLVAVTVLGIPGGLGVAPKDTDLPALPNPMQFHNQIVSAAQSVSNIASIFVLLGCAASVVVRRRHGSEVVREQIKVLLAAAALWPPVVVALLVLPSRIGDSVWGQLLFSVPVDVMVIAVGVAVFRYRLYDIDRVISRALAYVVVTGLLIGSYAGIVTLTTRLLPIGSAAGVATSTLVVAALFNPVRRRVQRAVDHRFNRRKYDAARVVAAYSAHVREGVELDDVVTGLLSTVSGAVQPTAASLWLCDQTR